MGPEPGRGNALTIAVLGQGSIGRRHAANLLALGCEVMVFDPVAAEVAEGATRVETAEAALEAAQAAVVASPTSEHLGQVRAALEHGCHVLSEKPLSTSTAGVDELVVLAGRGNLLLAVAMNLRFHPGPRAVKELVAGGAIGRPLAGHFTFGYHLPSWRPGTDYAQSYSARSELGGGVLLDVIHEFDYAAWILGAVTEVSAWAQRVSALDLDVEDIALVNARFADGAVGSFTLDYLDRSYRRGCRIIGEEASVRWSWRDEVVELLGPDGTGETRPAPASADESYRLEAAEFVATITGMSSADRSLAGAEEGRAALAVVEAALESAAAAGALTAVPAVP